MYSVDCCPKGLVIGKQGENEAEKIAIDFSPWASEFGAGTISARLRRPKDSAAYPVALITEGTTATWTISATDTQYAGAGSLQLVYIVGDVVAKSVIWPVRVLPSLEAGEAPEPYESWLDTLEGLAADTQGNARDAAASAADAAQSATSAAASAQDAAESAASITGLTAVAETLPEGSEASASFDGATDTLTLGIPKGDTGAAGPKGDTGAAGADGFSPSASVTKQDGNITITVTDKDGTTSETLEVDDALDETSENPVQNQAIQNALWNLLPTDTASGSIASFPDGADDVPMLSLKAQIEPVQDLHGYDSPWPAGGGKNKCMHYADRTNTNGITYTPTLDGIVVSGTATGASYSWDSTHSTYESALIKLPAGTYAFSANQVPGASQAQGYIVFMGQTEGGTAINNIVLAGTILTQTATFSEPVGIYYGIYVANGESVNMTVKLQIELGSTATSWTPYSNICPISGHTGVHVERTGGNIWDEEWESGQYNGNVNTGNITKAADNTRIRSKNDIPVKENTTYYVFAPQPLFAYFLDKDKNWMNRVGYNGTTLAKNASFTTPEGCAYIKFFTVNTAAYDKNISINYPSTDHEYHAYQGETIPVSWESEAGTVYGGELDVVSGKLTVDRVYALLDDASLWTEISSGTTPYAYQYYFRNRKIYANSYTGLMCSVMPVNSSNQNFTARWSSATSFTFCIKATNPELSIDVFKDLSSRRELSISYELAEPIEYTLTPQEVKTYLGQNNIWNDVGDTEVTYRADIAKYIEKKVNA